MTLSSSPLLAGIDTGGTYTDAALIDAETRKVIASAKALTTRGDLAIGVNEAVARALAQLGEGAARRISLVSLSTTLATNAVVEGHGSPVAVILIGFDARMVERSGLARAFPDMVIERIAGGHDHNGEAAAPLDEAALQTLVERHRDRVEAFAVAAQFAVRNPAHELKARDLILAASDRPVTLSSELSSALDAPRRALTAALNARLIGRISALIAAVERAMTGLGIAAPLMITRGDGTLALAASVARRPIETVLSGPAASLVGAAALSGLGDFILTDMGGTTTDLGIMANGRPSLSDSGAEVGGWRTMVRAIDVRTIGLGGDSTIDFMTDGTLLIGPRRMMPVALLAPGFPEVMEALDRELDDPEAMSGAGRFVLLPLGAGAPSPAAMLLSARERELIARVTDRPRSLRRLAVTSGAERTLAALAAKGLVQLAGFTPTDAAHVLGLQSNGSREAAMRAALLALRARGIKAPDHAAAEHLAREVWSETVRLSARAIVDVALGAPPAEIAKAALLTDPVCRGEPGLGLADLRITPRVPVIAVGGPVKVYHEEVARRLQCRMVFPDHWTVANAVGAASGVVARRVTIEITGDAGAFRVYRPAGVALCKSAAEAIALAEQTATEVARAAALGMGATTVAVTIAREIHRLPDAVDDNGLFKALITAEAIGHP